MMNEDVPRLLQLCKLNNFKKLQQQLSSNPINETDDSSNNFANADLRGGDFGGINLTDIQLEGANLRGVNLEDTTFQQGWKEPSGAIHDHRDRWHRYKLENMTGYCRASMNGVGLSGAKLGGADLRGIDLSGATFTEGCCPPEAEGKTGLELAIAWRNKAKEVTKKSMCKFFSKAGYAQMQQVNLERARLEGSDLSNVHLEGADLENAHLEGSNLEGTHLEGAYLRGVHIEGAYLRGVHLEGANLENAHLEGSNLEGAHLEGAYLGGAHMEGANLYGAHLQGATLCAANLEGAILDNVLLDNATDVTDAYLSNPLSSTFPRSQYSLRSRNTITRRQDTGDSKERDDEDIGDASCRSIRIGRIRYQHIATKDVSKSDRDEDILLNSRSFRSLRNTKRRLYGDIKKKDKDNEDVPNGRVRIGSVRYQHVETKSAERCEGDENMKIDRIRWKSLLLCTDAKSLLRELAHKTN